MADIIRLVKGDELPNVIITLTDDVAGAALNVSAVTTVVKVKFKAVFSNGNTQIRGSGTSDYTYFDFMRIGDT